MEPAPQRTEPESYYSPGADRARRVEDLFGKIARRYDLINDLQSFGLHRRWKQKLLDLANVQPGQRALDICCGTGDVALRLHARGAEVAGVDFSGPMLEVAEQRALGMAGLKFMRGDALHLPFPDQSFDLVTISYGLRNLSDLDRGLREMHRVLKPGGAMLILDFGKPDHPLWRSAYFAYLRWAVPIFGKIFCGDSATHAYILESLIKYPAQRGVAEKMERLGCEKVRILNLLGGVMSIHAGWRNQG